MGISIGDTASFLNNMTEQANGRRTAESRDKVKSSINGLSKNSTDKELTEAVKSFEQYFVEQMLKEVKKNSKVFSKEDSGDQLTDYYMDFAISSVAKEMVEKYGGGVTRDFVAQIKRNYGIPEEKEVKKV